MKIKPSRQEELIEKIITDIRTNVGWLVNSQPTMLDESALTTIRSILEVNLESTLTQNRESVIEGLEEVWREKYQHSEDNKGRYGLGLYNGFFSAIDEINKLTTLKQK